MGHKDAASGGVFSAEPGGHLLGRAHDGTVQHDVLFTFYDMSRQCWQVGVHVPGARMTDL